MTNEIKQWKPIYYIQTITWDRFYFKEWVDREIVEKQWNDPKCKEFNLSTPVRAIIPKNSISYISEYQPTWDLDEFIHRAWVTKQDQYKKAMDIRYKKIWKTFKTVSDLVSYTEKLIKEWKL